MTTVLMDHFGDLLLAGFADILHGEDVHVLEACGADFVQCVADAMPDAVVLDLDRDGRHELAFRLAARFPALTVVACSSRAPRMRVYPRFHHGESYDSELAPDLLSGAVRT